MFLARLSVQRPVLMTMIVGFFVVFGLIAYGQMPVALLPDFSLPYVMVDDLDASLARAKELGAKEHVGPTEVPKHGFFAVISDPTGGMIALWKCTAQK